LLFLSTALAASQQATAQQGDPGSLATPAANDATGITATRLGDAPLVTVDSSHTLAGNVNGPSLIRLPAWIEHPLGRYYLYFADHKGKFLRLPTQTRSPVRRRSTSQEFCRRNSV
jgi:hypothetical protein